MSRILYFVVPDIFTFSLGPRRYISLNLKVTFELSDIAFEITFARAGYMVYWRLEILPFPG